MRTLASPRMRPPSTATPAISPDEYGERAAHTLVPGSVAATPGSVRSQRLQALACNSVRPLPVVVLGRRGEGGAEVLDRLVPGAHELVRRAAAGVGGGVGFVLLERAREVAHGLLEAIHLAVDEAAVVAGVDEVRPHADQLVEVLQCRLVALQRTVDIAAVVAGVGVGGRLTQRQVVGRE